MRAGVGGRQHSIPGLRRSDATCHAILRRIVGPPTSHKPELAWRPPATFKRAGWTNIGAMRNGDCISADRFALTVITQPKSARHDYREMEAEAARYLAPMLRSVADKLQAQIEGSEAERAASPQKPE